VPYVKRGMKAPRFSSVELRVQGIASRETNNQLLRVPWGRFSQGLRGVSPLGKCWRSGARPSLERSAAHLRRSWQLSRSIVPVSSSGARDHNNPNAWRPCELDGASRRVSRLHADAEVRNRSAATVTDIWQARHNSGSSRPVLRTALQACR